MELENIIPNVSNSPVGFAIKNKQFINYLTKNINYLYNVKGKELVYPAPQPVSIEKKDFAKLVNFKYSVSLKLDGVRFLIYFIKDKNGRNQSILINRALVFYNIVIEADENIYNGTLLDGEVIYDKNENRWKFYVHDAIILGGNKINKLTHSVRLNDTRSFIESFIFS